MDAGGVQGRSDSKRLQAVFSSDMNYIPKRNRIVCGPIRLKRLTTTCLLRSGRLRG